MKKPGQGDERKIDGIEHHLNADEDDDRISPGQGSDNADRKKDCAQNQKTAGGTLGIVITLLLMFFPYFFFLLKTTAPTMAEREEQKQSQKGKDIE